MDIDDLALIQCQREWPTRIIQAGQNVLQQQILAAGVFESNKPFVPPLFVRLSVIRSAFPG